MRILCMIGSLSGGGAERQMIELMKILVSKGYNVSLLTYTNSDDYQCPSEVSRIIVKGHSKLGLTWKLIRILRKGKFDCCISFLQQNNFVACLATLPTKSFKLICGERNFSVYQSRLEKLLFYLYRRADFIVPNSCTQSQFIINCAPWLKEKIVTIANYTDTEKYKPIEFGRNISGKIVVGVFARYIQQKNPLYLAKVAERLKEMNYPYEFHWFGNNKLNRRELEIISPAYTELKDYVSNHKLSDFFFLHDFAKDTVREMNLVDVVAQASFYEGFPNSISEALSCGKAIIASNVSDTPHIVKEYENGFLFNPHDLMSGIDAFIRYYSLPDDEKKAMVLRNRTKALELFNRDKFGDAYIRLIES